MAAPPIRLTLPRRLLLYLQALTSHNSNRKQNSALTWYLCQFQQDHSKYVLGQADGWSEAFTFTLCERVE